MKTLRALVAISTILLAVSCGDSDKGGGGGSGGAGGRGGSGAGAGASGTAGATGSAGTGGGTGSCQACVACVNANCASAVTTCRANSGCNMIYQCANACAMSIQTCIANNLAAAQAFIGSVSACITSSCSTQCMY